MLIIDTAKKVSGHIDLLKSKNVIAVGRYFSPRKWKRITRDEAEKIAAAGLKLFTIFEDDGDPKLNSDLGNDAKSIFGQFDPHLADALIAEATEDDAGTEAPEAVPSELAFTAAAKTTLSATAALTEPAPEAYALTAWEELTKPPPSVLVKALAQKINASPEVLHYARNIATAIIDGPKNHCAVTLSAPLVFIGVYPNVKGIGAGDLEPEVIKLDWDLRRRRGWRKIPLGEKIEIGDVGVVLTEHDAHHIYLVIDPTDQSAPTFADNQLNGPHARAVAGDSAKSLSPTNYFLRAPALLGSE
jgi:hypothetical protein